MVDVSWAAKTCRENLLRIDSGLQNYELSHDVQIMEETVLTKRADREDYVFCKASGMNLHEDIQAKPPKYLSAFLRQAIQYR